MSTTRTVSNSVVIDAARERVFDFVADPANDPAWCSRVTAVAQTWASSGELTYHITHRPMVERRILVTRVLDVSRPSRVVLDERDGDLAMLVTYDLAELDTGGTRLTQTDVITVPLPRLVAGVVVATMSLAKRRQLLTLQRLLER